MRVAWIRLHWSVSRMIWTVWTSPERMHNIWINGKGQRADPGFQFHLEKTDVVYVGLWIGLQKLMINKFPQLLMYCLYTWCYDAFTTVACERHSCASSCHWFIEFSTILKTQIKSSLGARSSEKFSVKYTGLKSKFQEVQVAKQAIVLALQVQHVCHRSFLTDAFRRDGAWRRPSMCEIWYELHTFHRTVLGSTHTLFSPANTGSIINKYPQHSI